MADRKRIIAPSVLAADFADMGQAVRLAEEAGADWIHLDVMDGSFVPPITFGAQMIRDLRKLTELPFDAHLMTMHPGAHLQSFRDAGVDWFTFHLEAEPHAHRLLGEVKALGMKAGVSIVPSTPVSALSEILDMVDQVLVMTVNPGKGGQSLIPSTLNKVRQLAELRDRGAGDYLVAMDGGFAPETAAEIWGAGADVAVMGSAFFGAEDPRQAMNSCRKG